MHTGKKSLPKPDWRFGTFCALALTMQKLEEMGVWRFACQHKAVSVAAPADSEGAVSCLISHKTTVFKWAGLAAASEHKGFLLFPSS